MLIEKDIQEILNQLAGGDSIKVPFDGSTIMMRVIDDASKLSLTAPGLSRGKLYPFERRPLFIS